MSRLHLLNFNNYYNRQVKKLYTLAEYELHQIGGTIENINFIYNDGIWTEQIVNWPASYAIPDYVIVEESSTDFTRWFVIESVRTRKGQYKLTLRRDIIAENLDNILDSPCFVEKAMLNTADPMIFNKEDMTFNQIKKKEIPMYDRTGIPWVVGYVPRDTAKSQDISVNWSAEGAQANYEYDSIAEFKSQYMYGQYYENRVARLYSDVKFYFVGLGKDFTLRRGDFQGWRYDLLYTTNTSSGSYGYVFTPTAYPIDIYTGIGTDKLSALYSSFRSQYDENSTIFYGIQEEAGKLVKIGNDYYTIQYSTSETTLTNQTVNNASNTGLAMINCMTNNPSGYPVDNIPDGANKVDYTYKSIKLQLTRTNAVSGTIKFNKSTTRAHLDDAPYDMFCMPYGSVKFKDSNSSSTVYQTDKTVAMGIASALTITENIGIEGIYDLQLLPYCPIAEIRNSWSTTTSFNIDLALVNNYDKAYAISGGTNVGFMLWCNVSSFDFIHYHEAVVNTKMEFYSPEEVKVLNETMVARMCSPNYNGIFEYSPMMNGANERVSTRQRFKAVCTYKPFNPYIQVSPIFHNLYGEDFGDARGLICGGDFSLPIVSSAWTEYQLQNKNYQNIFDRQITNLGITQKVERVNDIFKMVSSSISGAAGGALTGMSMGSGIGAGIGAAVGGAASVGGGIADLYYNDMLRTEAIDYQKDLYNYQLGNIKALPQSLTKVSAFNANNKLVPFIEVYEATDEEKEALRNKIKYNGMTVGRIDKLRNFVRTEETYMKGSMIRIENILEDFNYVKELTDEVFKGFFIKESDING